MTLQRTRRTFLAETVAACALLSTLGCVSQERDRGKPDAGGTVEVFGGSSNLDALAGYTGALCTAKSAVASMQLGWNLGNSLDSVSGNADADAELAWHNPRVTGDLFKVVAAAGFGVVRIPVSWIGRFGPAPDYTISPTFIDRVEEVVTYALDQGLYVIINLHHDGASGMAGRWINLVDSSGLVTAANNEQVKTQFTKIWAQIAERFKRYGDHLIFESMNEVAGPASKPVQAYYDQVNALNQAFVDTIRSGDGNNLGRCLVVPGYNTNINDTVAGFKVPNDVGPDMLILSDHYYDPWSFAGAGTTHAWGTGHPGIDTWGQEDWVASQVAKLKTSYIDHGLPVIWGEYGAVTQTGYETYRRYYMEYVTKVAHDAGIVPIVWDNNNWAGSGDDAFGFINRASNTVQYPAMVDAMVRAATSAYGLADVAKP
jgi:endoglucanase